MKHIIKMDQHPSNPNTFAFLVFDSDTNVLQWVKATITGGDFEKPSSWS